MGLLCKLACADNVKECIRMMMRHHLMVTLKERLEQQCHQLPFLSKTDVLYPSSTDMSSENSIRAAKDVETGQEVAIKKVTKIFDKPILAKRALRELKLLVHFNGHENVCALLSSYVCGDRDSHTL